MNFKLKERKGITLIALVITIVVLLILAAVSIATLTGENGILTQANRAKNETKEAEGEENDILADYEDVLEEYSNPEKKLMKLVVNSGTSKKVELPIEPNQENDYTIDWGDGTTAKVDSEEKEISKLASVDSIKVAIKSAQAVEHTYAEANTEYTVTIDGTLKELYGFCGNNSVIKIEQWGETGLTIVSLGGCYNLIEIASPTKNSFSSVTDFSGTFYGCTSLTSIPEKLFANCPNVTDFSDTFHGCTSLTSIPEKLFDNCPNVTDFSGTFYRCTSLTSIPEKLFANCPNVTDFPDTFYGCTSLTSIPEKLFDNCPNLSSFYGTFAGCTGLTGKVPELWTRGTNSAENDYKGDPDGKSCFYQCDGVSNYDEIPEYWKEEDKGPL